MKITKILSVAAFSTALFLSSCSMNKDAIDSACLQSGKMQSGQQLTRQNNPNQPLATVDAPIIQRAVHNDAGIAPNSSRYVPVATLQKQPKSFVRNNILKKTGTNLAQIIAFPKAAGTINKLIKSGFTASHKSNPFEGMNYLLMWIVFLLASILLYALAGIVGATTILGTLLTILGLIAGLLFLLFLILWILQLVKG